MPAYVPEFGSPEHLRRLRALGALAAPAPYASEVDAFRRRRLEVTGLPPYSSEVSAFRRATPEARRRMFEAGS